MHEPVQRGAAIPPARLATALLIAAAAIGFVWLALSVLLLAFAAILLAVGLNALAGTLARRLRLPYEAALALAVLIVVVPLASLIWLSAPGLSEQFSQLASQVSATAADVRKYLEATEWGRTLLRQGGEAPSGSQVASRVAGVTFGMFGALANLVFVVILAIFLAARPGLYRRGVLRLVPPARRPRAAQVLGEIGRTLRWWLLGQLVAMTFLGTLAAVGLYLIGISLWLPLALITALLNFVPYIGPLVAAVPVIAVAMAQGGVETALYAAALYVVLQSVEGYFLTPMIQQRAVSLPPAVTISSQLVMAVLAGPLGVMVATPLAAVTLVAVRMIYVEGILGDRPDAAASEG